MKASSITTSSLNNFAVIEVSGADSIKFLQGQLTINIESLAVNQLALAASCNPQGRCISLFFLIKIASQTPTVQLILHKSTVESSIANLNKYAVFFNLNITDKSDDFQLYGLAADKNIQTSLPAEHVFYLHDTPLAIAVLAKNAGYADDDKHTLHDEQNWLYQLALAGIPWLTELAQSQFLPHNLNLPDLQAVDFNKGCYTGQEVVARMQYKAKLKSHMRLFCCDQDIEAEAMDDIQYQGESAAKVICSASNSYGQSLLLALLKDNYAQTNIKHNEFRLQNENSPILELINLR